MTDPSICYNNFINILNDIVNKNCPLIKKKANINTTYNPWLTNKLKNAIKKKNKLFSLYKSTNCMSILNRYTKLKNKIKKNIKHNKNNYYKQLFSHNKQEDNWKIINKLIKRKENEYPYIFIYKDIEIYDEIDQCNCFNKYFATIGKTINNAIEISSEKYSFKQFLTNYSKSFYFLPITNNEIINVADSMKSKNSKDINNYNMYLIKEIIYEILIPLNHLFNLCIDKSIYPDNMKDAIIKPIYKNNNIQLITNYRPISLLPQISKIFEKIIYSRLSNFIHKNNIINNNQYGFIPNSNTTLSLINIQHFILKNTNNNKKVATIFLDLKKAFDM